MFSLHFRALGPGFLNKIIGLVKFPHFLKVGKVTQIYKKEDHQLLDNYRPAYLPKRKISQLQCCNDSHAYGRASEPRQLASTQVKPVPAGVQRHSPPVFLKNPKQFRPLRAILALKLTLIY